MSKIKICGLSKQQDIEAVNMVLPDYIGFVFAPSKRQVNYETAGILKGALHTSIKSVGVFVNETVDTIAKLCDSQIIDIIQLHGDEDEGYINTLKRQVSNPIIKAIRVRNPKDIQLANSISCDYLLFDTFKENQYGGSGKVFDWSVLSDITKPYFLAGGIHTDNILQAEEQCHPFCIDVSSGVETDGCKDRNKIIEIVSKVRNIR